MKNTLLHPLLILFLLLTSYSFGQTHTEVSLVDESDIDVQYFGEESYIAYLSARGIPKDNIYKDYYTDEFFFDLGKIKTGEVRTVEIPFKNDSDNYVKITTVNELCACLKADFPEGDAGKIKPGDTKKGTLMFDTTNIKGKLRRAVEIRTFTNMKEINYLVWVQAEIGD